MAYGLSHALLAVSLLALHGRAFGLVTSASVRYNEVGNVLCGRSHTAEILTGRCPTVALPDGAAVGNGWPIIVVESLLARLPGVSAGAAIDITAVALMALAVVGTTALLRRFGSSRWIAFVGTASYLSSITMLGMGQFGSTFWGIAAVPAVIWTFLKGLASLDASRRRRSVAVISGLGVLTFVVLMIDGYGTVLAFAAIGIVALGRAIKKDLRQRAYWETTGLAAATLIGLAMFKLFPTSEAGWGKSSIALFRSMGADLITFLVPGDEPWWGPWTHLSPPAELWGDGSNVRYNFLGYILVIAAITAAIIAVRRRSQLALWGVIGAVAFAMSLGPSLKFEAVRGPLEPPITYNSYLMPPDEAVITLPTAAAYKYVPGLSMLRATYRWNALTSLSLIVLAGYGLTLFSRRGKRSTVVAYAGMALIALETAPNIPDVIDTNTQRGAAVERFTVDVANPLSTMVEPGSRVVIAPGAQGGNDYQASYLAGVGNYRTYNVGGDKALIAATPTWPDEIRALLLGEDDFANRAYTALASGDADVLVIPFFDLRWGIDSWPADEQWAQRGLAAYDDLGSDGRFNVIRMDYFAVVTLADDRAR
jgi:hypothetical protein